MLESALDIGLRELEFWDMTVGEVLRAITSFNRRTKLEAQEKASYDYILANLITKGVAIAMGAKTTMPSLHDSYPDLFAEQMEAHKEVVQSKKNQLSALRFKQFAQSYNSRFKNKEVQKADT